MQTTANRLTDTLAHFKVRHLLSLSVFLAACSSGNDVEPLADSSPQDSATDTRDAEIQTDTAFVDTTELDDSKPVHCERPFSDLQWGSAMDDEVLGLASDASGAVYAVGYTGGKLGEANDGPTGDSKGFVRQLLRGGAGFERIVDTNTTDAVDAVAVHWDGQVYFAGRTRGALSGATNKGSFDLVYGRVDPAGVMHGLTQLGTAAPDHPMRIASEGPGLAIGGYTDVHVVGSAVEAWEDPFVAFFDLLPGSAPNRLWTWHASTESSDRGRAIAVNAAGHTFAVGSAEAGAGRGAIIIELDRAGRLMRRHVWSAGPLETIAAAKFAKDGDLLIAGSTARRLGEAHYGGQDAFVAKLDPITLNARWVRQLGRASAEWIEDMAVSPSGVIVAVGETVGDDTRGGSDAFAIAVAPTGAALWSWQGASEGEDAFHSVTIDACGDVIAGGWSMGATTGGKHRDAVIRKLPAL